VTDVQVVERKLAVIFAADVAEYSRLMGLDEVGTLRTLQAYRAIAPKVSRCDSASACIWGT